MDASNVCRLCLKSQDTASVFLVLNGNERLVELIFQLLEIEVKPINPNNSEDYYICFDCHDVLRNFKEFKTKCLKNDIEFRNRYKLIKDECVEESKQESEWTIKIADYVIQSDELFNIQTCQEDSEEETLEIIIDNTSSESNPTANDAEITEIQKNDKRKKTWWTERDRERIPCEICGKQIFRACYKAHVSLHDPNIRRFQCQMCDRSYKQKHNLTKHLNTHTKKVQFICSEITCRKVFDFASDQRKHFKICHTNIRDYICKICGRAFAHSSGLSGHMHSHNTEKKYACTGCGKLFKTSQQARMHSKSHI